MSWTDERVVAPPRRTDLAKVHETYIGDNFARDAQLVAIDFAAHPALDVPLDQVDIRLGANNAEPEIATWQRNPETGGLRVAFTFDPAESAEVEFRMQLFHERQPISEVWIYRWTPAT